MLNYSNFKKIFKSFVPVFLYKRISQLKHILRNIFFKEYILDYKYDGIDFKFNIYDYNSKDWYDSDIIAKNEINILKNFKFKKVLYCGSHQAVIPIIINKVFNVNEIICYEALKSNVDISNLNLKSNSINNIKIYHGAISSQDGFINIKNNTYNSFIETETKNSIETKSFSLKNIIANSFFDLVILDIEGYELEALSNCNLNNINKCLIELHGDKMLSKYNFINKDILKIFDFTKFKIEIYDEINENLKLVTKEIYIPNTRCWILITNKSNDFIKL